MNWNIRSWLSNLACNVNQLTTQPFRSGSGRVLKINMLSLSLSTKAHEKEKNMKHKIQDLNHKIRNHQCTKLLKYMLLQNENNYNPMTFRYTVLHNRWYVLNTA